MTQPAAKYAPEDPANNAFVYGYVATGTPIVPPKGNYKLYPDVYNFSHVHAAVTIDYASTANVSACENCHGKPYRKHGYRMAVVARPATTSWAARPATPTSASAATSSGSRWSTIPVGLGRRHGA